MLFDTDVLIWALRGSSKAASLLTQTEERAISAVTYMELMQGARNKTEQTQIRQFLHLLDFQVLPITENISHRATIFVEENALKTGIRLADALVFATACEHSQVLCTANQKHCKSIATLQTNIFLA